MFQKGAFHFGINFFNHLLSSNKNVSGREKIETCFKKVSSQELILYNG
jgi:hypothetical protein